MEKKSNTKKKQKFLALDLAKSFMRQNKGLVIVYLIIICSVTPVEIFLFPRQISSVIETFQKQDKIESLDIFIKIVSCLFLVMTLTLLKRKMENTIIPKFSIFTRKWIFQYIIKQNQTRHEQLSIGKIMSILSELPSSVRNAVIVFLRNLLPYLIGFFALTIYFFTFDKKIGYLQLFTLIFWILIFVFRSKTCINIFEKAQDDVINIYESVQDKLSNLISIYSSQTEQLEIKNHNVDENVNEKKYYRSLNCILTTELMSNSFILVSFVIFNLLVIKAHKNKTLTTKSISTLYILEYYYWIVFLRRIESNIGEFIHSIGNVKSIDKFFGKMKNNEQRNNRDNSFKLENDKKVVIKFDHVFFKYNFFNKYIIKKLNFEVYNNEVVWIKGHSGSGKSTVFKLIMGYLQPTQGNIYLFGKDISKTNIYHLRDVITYVEQDTNLFDSDIYSNIVYGNEHISKQDIFNVLNNVDVKIFNKLSNGIQTKVGILGSKISGGQRQVILLLRAYFRKNTKIILLDEPISAVDVDTIPEIVKLIKFMSKSKVLLIISHNSDISNIVTKSIDLNL